MIQHWWLLPAWLIIVIVLFSARRVRQNESSRYCYAVRPSVCLWRACIVIIRCTLAPIQVYGWIVQCFDIKACPPVLPAIFAFFIMFKAVAATITNWYCKVESAESVSFLDWLKTCWNIGLITGRENVCNRPVTALTISMLVDQRIPVCQDKISYAVVTCEIKQWNNFKIIIIVFYPHATTSVVWNSNKIISALNE